MAQRDLCISNLSWVHTDLNRSAPLSLWRQYSATSVCRQYLQVISADLLPRCAEGHGDTLRDIQYHEPQWSTPIPLHWDLPWWYSGQSLLQSRYHINSQTIRHWTLSPYPDAHGSQCITRLGRISGGEGIVGQHRQSHSQGITNVRSAWNAARYLACGCCCVSLQFVAIHQPYDCC